MRRSAPPLGTSRKTTNKIDEHVIKSGIDELDEFIDPTTSVAYIKIKALGKGGFAKVYQCKRSRPYSDSDPDVALKIIPKSRVAKPSQLEKIHSEISIQQQLDHPNIVKLLTSFEDATKICISVELCNRKSLTSLLKQRGQVPQDEVSRIGVSIIHALKYIHARGIVHRDLKLGNILLTENGTAKLGDFGLAMFYEKAKPGNICGTPNFIAPEVLSEHVHGPMADLWALGCVLCTLLAGKPCFEYTNMKETYQRILKLKYNLPEWLSDEAKDLIRKMLVPDPEKRITHNQILAHPMIQGRPLGSIMNHDRHRSSDTALHPLTNLKRRMSDAENQPRVARRLSETFKKENGAAIVKVEATAPSGSTQQHFTQRPNRPPPLSLQNNHNYKGYNNAVNTKPLSPISPKYDYPNRIIERHRVVWVTKWVDYTNKLGFGYKLSDGKIGANMPSPSKSFIVLSRDGRTADDYSEFRDIRSSFNYHAITQSYHSRHKKILDYFIKYMSENLCSGANNLQILSREAADDVNDVRLLHHRSFETDSHYKTAMALVLSNDSLQVNFSRLKMIVHKPFSLAESVILLIDNQRNAQAFDNSTMYLFPKSETNALQHVHRIFHAINDESHLCWSPSGWGSILCQLSNSVGHV